MRFSLVLLLLLTSLGGCIVQRSDDDDATADDDDSAGDDDDDDATDDDDSAGDDDDATGDDDDSATGDDDDSATGDDDDSATGDDDDATGDAGCLASGGWTQPDTDGDGLPDDCLLSVLLEDGGSFVNDNIQTELLSRGWTVDYLPSATIAAMTDFSAYDVVALTFPGSAQSTAYAANAVDAVGLIIHRGGADFADSGLGTDTWYQSDICEVVDNTHFVTQVFSLGPLPLDYVYKTLVNGASANTTALVSCTGPSLLVHPTLRRLTTPYYGHDSGMPWNADGDLLDVRSYAWAAGFGP